MLESWYWWLVAMLAGSGTLMFTLSSRRYHEFGRERMRGLDLAMGLGGLLLGCWGVLLAIAGGLYWLVLVAWGTCIP
jgi:hypothetical protein